MSISNRSSAAAVTAKAATSGAKEPKHANRPTLNRPRFALTHASHALDHRQIAARRDLADIDLAGRWFAPHYAVPDAKSCWMQGADILSSDGPTRERISQLLPGEEFAVIEESGDLAWGFSAHDHYVGHVQARALHDLRQPSHIVVARAALIFAEPSSRAACVDTLPMGAQLAGSVEGDFLRTAQGFVPTRLLHAVGDHGHDAVAIAERLVGTPYLWGGRGLGGIDCSGLVQIAYGICGVPLPRDSDQQMTAGSDASGNARRGDLCFFPEHVVLLTGPNDAVHASGYWMAVVAEPLADIISRMGDPIARRRV